MRIPLFHINAFTHEPFSGNPAAVCLLDSWLDDQHLRKVAAENNLSATAFLVARENSLELRWFTPVREIRLCGHATLATAHLISTFLQPKRDVLPFSTRFSGILTARKEGSLIAMDFPAFVPKDCPRPPAELQSALGIGEAPSAVLETNDAYIAVFDSQDAIRKIIPNFALLESFHPAVVMATAPGDARDADFVTRYFAPSYGVPEDPVTGSAHCSLAPYWAKRLGRTHLHARQLSERGGELWCELTGNRVILKGQAVLTMEGTLTI